MSRGPVLYDPATDTLPVEVRPRPAGSPAEVNERVGGEDAEAGLVIHYGPDGLPHAYEAEHASERPALIARALGALRAARGYAAWLARPDGARRPIGILECEMRPRWDRLSVWNAAVPGL